MRSCVATGRQSVELHVCICMCVSVCKGERESEAVSVGQPWEGGGGGSTMSTTEPATVHSPSSAGPTIEWLEPKLPDILKNGSSSLGSFAAGDVTLEGSRLELSSPESCSFSGVRPRK